MTILEDFESFLAKIDLQKYREQYSPIKLVELDLPKEIQALRHIYEIYWFERDPNKWLNFEDFYKVYSIDLQGELEAFRIKTQFSKETFELGLPARIYRTWASLLTQIQGAYVAEEIYGKGKVLMGEKLDRRGTDIMLNLERGKISIQVKKESRRKEARQAVEYMKTKKEEIYKLFYVVPRDKYTKKTHQLSKPYIEWEREWKNKLEVLSNGFVVFRKPMFMLDIMRKDLRN